MKKLNRWMATGLVLSATGCSIHPLPEDVTGDNTYLIVEKIRCEARGGIRAKLIDQLMDPPMHELVTPAERRKSMLIAQRLKSGDLTMVQLIDLFAENPTIVDPITRGEIEAFKNTAIAYKFEFDISENNNDVVNAGFSDRIGIGTLDLSLQGGSDRLRQNKRTFTIADTFDGIFLTLEDTTCEKYNELAPNYVYPITGRIGLYEVISTFLDLASIADFGSGEANKFVEAIKFETKFYGSVTPVIEFDVVGGDFQPTKLDGQMKANRIDVHQVTVSLAVQPPDPKPAPIVPVQRRTVTPGASAKLRALENIQTEQFLGVQEDIRDQLERIR